MNGFSYAKTIRICNVYPGFILIPIGKEKEREEIYFMNKYSKRALKTTATIGMSLAMGLSGVAAPVNAANGATCASTDTNCKELFYDLSAAIKKIGLDELTVDSEAKIAGADAGIIATIIINAVKLKTNLTGSDYANLKDWLAVTDVIAADTETDATTKGMFSTAYFAATPTDALAKTGGLVNYYNSQLTNTWTVEAMKTNSKDAVKAYEKMAGWVADGFYDRLDETLAERFDAVYDALEERTADYVVADSDVTREFIAAWSIVLEADMDGTKDATIKFSNNSATNDKLFAVTGLAAATTIDLGSKSAIKSRIDSIKDAPNYYRVKEDDGVLEIIEQYNNLLGDITDLKSLLKDDAYKAFTSTKVKTNDADATLKAFFKSADLKITTTESLKDQAVEIGKQLTAEQLEVLVDLKENVLDYAYNFEAKKVGNYYVDKSDFVTGFTGKSTVTADLGKTKDVMFALVDNKEGLFGIDVVIEQAQKAVDAYAAATTEIEKITPANIKASDKAKLVAAEDAYYDMMDSKAFGKNLTKTQVRELRRIYTKIENLREAFDNLGTTTATGWYDKGNGNWGYNNEDGTAATKWVAAGSDWYYVKGGNMLRNAWVAQDASGAKWYYVDNAGKMVSNTTIDGFVIDANGVWTK